MEIEPTINISNTTQQAYIADLLIQLKESILREDDENKTMLLSLIQSQGIPVTVKNINTLLDIYKDITGPVKFYITRGSVSNNNKIVMRVVGYTLASQVYTYLVISRASTDKIGEWRQFAEDVARKEGIIE